MSAFLRWLIGWPWCSHKWDVRNDVRIFESGDTSKLPIGRMFVLQCEKCGDLKTRCM